MKICSKLLNNGLKITSPVPGTRFDIGEGEFTILAPNRSRYDDINDYSVVIKLQYKNTAFLFTGMRALNQRLRCWIKDMT